MLTVPEVWVVFDLRAHYWAYTLWGICSYRKED